MSNTLRKDMNMISQFAQLLQAVSYLQRASESESLFEDGDEADLAIADRLNAWLAQGVEILKQIVEDETNELIADESDTTEGETAGNGATDDQGSGKAANFTNKETNTMLDHEMAKAVHKGLAAHFVKAASFHTNMATQSDKAASCHDAMADYHTATSKAAGKPEADPDSAAQAQFHKGMKGTFEKAAAEHRGHAADCNKCAVKENAAADAAGKLATGDAAKAAEVVASADKDGVTEIDAALAAGDKKEAAKAAPVDATMTDPAALSELIAKAVADAMPKLEPVAAPTPITAESIAAMVKSAVDSAVSKQIAPDGVKLVGKTLVGRNGTVLQKTTGEIPVGI